MRAGDAAFRARAGTIDETTLCGEAGATAGLALGVETIPRVCGTAVLAKVSSRLVVERRRVATFGWALGSAFIWVSR